MNPNQAAETVREAAARIIETEAGLWARAAAVKLAKLVRAIPIPADAKWTCKGHVSTVDGPGECDWPFCGCDPEANKLIAHFQECDMTLVRNPGKENTQSHAAAVAEAYREILHKHSSTIRERVLREAAAVVGTMAERPYDTDPEFSVVLNIEAAILALIPLQQT